jgi:hypothetical protein
LFSAIWDVAVNLVAVFIVFVARLLGFDTYARLVRSMRRLPPAVRHFRGRRTVLLYTDCDDELHASRAMAESLERKLSQPGRPVTVSVLRDGTDLTRSPFSARTVLALVILLTDVTQLDARPRDRARVQDRIIKYVHKGGRVILGHDVIYRRTKNDRLQRLAGCALDKFHRLEEPTKYLKVASGDRATSDTGLLDMLPDDFCLSDNEVVVGDWDADVEYLYVWGSEEHKDVPLVTRRCVGKGRVFWINSGDSSSAGPPRSIGRPEPELISLLSALIDGK